MNASIRKLWEQYVPQLDVLMDGSDLVNLASTVSVLRDVVTEQAEVIAELLDKLEARGGCSCG